MTLENINFQQEIGLHSTDSPANHVSFKLVASTHLEKILAKLDHLRR